MFNCCFKYTLLYKGCQGLLYIFLLEILYKLVEACPLLAAVFLNGFAKAYPNTPIAQTIQGWYNIANVTTINS